jgi:hypothetical protein
VLACEQEIDLISSGWIVDVRKELPDVIGSPRCRQSRREAGLGSRLGKVKLAAGSARPSAVGFCVGPADRDKTGVLKATLSF